MTLDASFVIALDLGGTDLKFALARRDGTLKGFGREPSRTLESAEAPIETILTVAERLRNEAGGAVQAVGLGCPGVIHPRSRRLVDRTVHLPHWHDLPIGELLANRLHLPVAADNDANLAALAEERLGAARGARVSLTITLGTGLGCGIIIDGRVFHGAWGGAGELGHIALGSTSKACGCGVPECIEPEASGSGLVEEARRLGLEPAAASTLFEAAARGNPDAAAVIDRFIDRLGMLIATAIALMNPEVVVIGGGVAKAGDALLIERLRAAVARYALASHQRGLRIVPAALGERAGVVGAGLMAWSRLAVPTR